jgi:hypothetical protein
MVYTSTSAINCTVSFYDAAKIVFTEYGFEGPAGSASQMPIIAPPSDLSGNTIYAVNVVSGAGVINVYNNGWIDKRGK